MRKRASICLCVGFVAVAVAAVPLSRLVAQGELPPLPGPVTENVSPLPPLESPRLAPPARASTPPLKESKADTPTMMVNTRRVRLNYSLRDVGPSGVSAVELWATRDGRNWQCYSNEPPPDGPLVVHVAEEGRYGFFLVVKSGVGTKSPAPKPGDQPQVWVEVDETLPAVKLGDVQVGKGADAGMLLVNWSASDAHLMPRPISIRMGPSKDGPWSPIASGVENTGRYAWQMPKEMPYRFFVKVEAMDRAGNVGSACMQEAVRVDRAKPRGVILGVDLEHTEVKVEGKNVTGVLTTPVTLNR